MVAAASESGRNRLAASYGEFYRRVHTLVLVPSIAKFVSTDALARISANGTLRTFGLADDRQLFEE
jgi:hypothetical protein